MNHVTFPIPPSAPITCCSRCGREVRTVMFDGRPVFVNTDGRVHYSTCSILPPSNPKEA